MSVYVLDQAFRIAAPNGVEAGRAVVRGNAAGECALPAGANVPNVVGITTHAQPRTGRSVGVRRLGVVPVVAAGAIARGAAVAVADATGRVRTAEAPRFTTGVVGSNNALVFEWLGGPLGAATVLELVNPDASEPFSWSFAAGALRLSLAHNGTAITMTAAQLVAAIAADATLSRLLVATHASGSSGAGTLGAATSAITNLPATLFPLGIAEQPATQAGDIIDVFLTLP